MFQGLLTGLQGLIPGMSGAMPSGAMMGPMGVMNQPTPGLLQGLLGGGQLPNMRGMMPQQGINLAGMGQRMMGLPPAAQGGFDPSVVRNDILGAVQDPNVTSDKFAELLQMAAMAGGAQPAQQEPPMMMPPSPQVGGRPAQVVNPYGARQASAWMPGPLGGR